MKIRTVTVNDRGQIVIPEDMRKDLGIQKASTLVLVESGNEIILRKELDILEALKNEDKFWNALTEESMKRAWHKEDEVWDKVFNEEENK